MSIKQTILGLAAIAALAVAVPALARTHSAAHHHAPTPVASSSSPSFTTPALTDADGARLAKTGSLTLPIDFTGPATVAATGEGPVGTARTEVLGSGPGGDSEWIEIPRDYGPIVVPTSVTATGPGTADLTLTLNSAAKAKLASGRDLEMLLSLESSRSTPSLEMFVLLPGS